MFIIALHLFLLSTVFVNGEDPDDTDVDNLDEENIWHPNNVTTREEFLRCRGMPCDQWKKRQWKLMQLDFMLKQGQEQLKDVETEGTEALSPEIMSEQALEIADVEKDACAYLTESQIDQLVHDVMNQNNTKNKRKLYNRVMTRHALWSLPIVWKFDGTHTKREQKIIRHAFTQWEVKTCLTFVEIRPKTTYKKNHLLFTRNDNGCYAYIGRVSSMIPQLVNLGSKCFFAPGVAVHEIGHALGLFHEHQRSDRDDYISLNLGNSNAFQTQFAIYKTENIADYDYGSVMHYAAKSFSNDNKPIIQPKDKRYLHSMGQRVGLSFADAKTINLSPYCANQCSKKLKRPCMRNGYQNPNNCYVCICPPGFGGDFCETVAPPKNFHCGGVFYVKHKHVVRSPGYPERHYPNNIECNWLIKSPPNTKLKLKFRGEFGVFKYTSTGSCYHWVEVQYNDKIGVSGPRFCGITSPEELRTDSNEMLIMLRSKYVVVSTIPRRGFFAIVEVIHLAPPLSTTTKLPEPETMVINNKTLKCINTETLGIKYCYTLSYYIYYCIIHQSGNTRCFKKYRKNPIQDNQVKMLITEKDVSKKATVKNRSVYAQDEAPEQISAASSQSSEISKPQLEDSNKNGRESWLVCRKYEKNGNVLCFKKIRTGNKEVIPKTTTTTFKDAPTRAMDTAALPSQSVDIGSNEEEWLWCKKINISGKVACIARPNNSNTNQITISGSIVISEKQNTPPQKTVSQSTKIFDIQPEKRRITKSSRVSSSIKVQPVKSITGNKPSTTSPFHAIKVPILTTTRVESITLAPTLSHQPYNNSRNSSKHKSSRHNIPKIVSMCKNVIKQTGQLLCYRIQKHREKDIWCREISEGNSCFALHKIKGKNKWCMWDKFSKQNHCFQYLVRRIHGRVISAKFVINQPISKPKQYSNRQNNVKKSYVQGVSMKAKKSVRPRTPHKRKIRTLCRKSETTGRIFCFKVRSKANFPGD